MKLTHVRVSVLESGPGYNNQSVTLEAELEAGDDYAEVAAELRARCKSQIKGVKEIESLWTSVNDLRVEQNDLQALCGRLKAQVDQQRRIIREHEKLAEIAVERGIVHTLPFDEIPF